MLDSNHHIYKKILYVVLGLTIALILFYGARLLFLKDYAADSSQIIYSQLDEARLALKNLDTEAVQSSLRAVSAQIHSVEASGERFGVLSLATTWSRFTDKLKNVPTLLQTITSLSETAVHVSDDIHDIKTNGLKLIITKQGPELLEKFEKLKSKVLVLASLALKLKQQPGLSAEARSGIDELYTELFKTAEVLDEALAFFGSETERNIVLLFQNPSEIRPTGGFIGSYAHVVIKQANLESISVHDIYDPDGQLAITVRPPRILDRITPTWGARDANWFFDFPASAEKVLYFLNNSKIYSEKNITFDGALAINTVVLQDIINLIGTIELPEYGLSLTAENFLGEIQREVESGEDKARGEPKRILKVIAPLVLERIGSLTEDTKRTLIRELAYHLRSKDMMVYIRNRALQGYLTSLGFTGEVATTHPRRVSEYLALVNANIAGGKSDAFVTEKINLTSRIGLDGLITNTLSITRAHTGQDKSEWWYKATNKNYLQVYMPIGSKIIAAAGQTPWPEPTRQNVRGVTDDDIEIIEETVRFLPEFNLERFIAYNKYVYAAWLSTPAGQTKTLSLTYQNPRPLYPALKIPYEFIFDKQSGVATEVSFSIEAPSGYIWAETNTQTLSYQSSDVPARVKLVGTLTPVNRAGAK